MTEEWKSKSAQTIEVKIFIAGDYKEIQRVCRQYCKQGFCVSMKAADFVFTYGMESGAEITIINYPRFPAAAVTLHQHALQLARLMAEETHQGSYTVQGPLATEFHSRRDFDQ